MPLPKVAGGVWKNDLLASIPLDNFMRGTEEHHPPLKSTRFASDVLRTCDFVGIAPEKVNTCFASASFFFERYKYKFVIP